MSNFNVVNSKTLSKEKNSVRVVSFGIVTRVIAIIFCAILLSNIIRNVFSLGSVTFTGFLQYISSVPQINTSLSMSTLYISGEWVILDGFRVFLNTIMQPLNLLVFLAKNLWNCLLYVIYFLRFLLGA